MRAASSRRFHRSHYRFVYDELLSARFKKHRPYHSIIDQPRFKEDNHEQV